MSESLDTRTTPRKATGRYVRPFRTFYYDSPNCKETEWSKIGHACTRIGALRAAVVKMLNGTAYHVDVYGEDGVRVAYATRKGSKITIICV
jgi:hypothetical protein